VNWRWSEKPACAALAALNLAIGLNVNAPAGDRPGGRLQVLVSVV
jgi:hypothetical protein